MPVEDDDSSTTFGTLSAPYPDEQVALAEQDAFRYGFSNHYNWNQKRLFDDPRLQALKMKDYRVVVPFNIADGKDKNGAECRRQWERFRDSYVAAREQQMSVMVAFERASNCQKGMNDERSSRLLPTKKRYLKLVRRFRKQFPEVKWFAAWNEPNHPSQPTSLRNKRKGGGPKRAATYAKLLLDHPCKPTSNKCRVVGAELAEKYSWRSYLDKYIGHFGQRKPAKWGIHPYPDVNQGVTGNSDPTRTGRIPGVDDFRSRIRQIDPAYRVWFTEVGSWRKRGAEGGENGTDVKTVQSPEQQAEEVRYLVDDLAPRVNAQRVYYWSYWDHRGHTDRGFDTMLIEMPPTSSDVNTSEHPSTEYPARPAYDVYKCYLRTEAGC